MSQGNFQRQQVWVLSHHGEFWSKVQGVSLCLQCPRLLLSNASTEESNLIATKPCTDGLVNALEMLHYLLAIRSYAELC
jgi:hypothetical protein